MLTIKDIKYIRSLSQKKYRQKYNIFAIEGEKMILETIFFATDRLVKLYCLPEFKDKYLNILSQIEQKIEILSPKELKKISNLKTPNQGLVLVEMEYENLNKIKNSDFILYLDDIRDPGNMGTIIRTADWFDVDLIVVSDNSVDIYNPKVLQSSMGSIFRLPIVKMDFQKLLKFTENKNFKFYGMMMSGESIYEIKYDFPIVVVIGNESNGISEKIISKLNKNITIPRFNKNTESLNASIASAIVISEIKRSKLKS